MNTAFCIMPDPEDFPDRDEPPEGFNEWRTSEQCNHEECLIADGYAREYARAPKPMTQEEREEIESDNELMLDEMHGRGLGGEL